MKKLRIGFAGVGGMGQMAHLNNYNVLTEECEVVALSEPRPQQAKLVGARYGVPKVYEDYREMIEREQLDGVIASQSYRLHASLLPDLIRSGLPFFTEKPLCLSVEEGERLVALGDAHGSLHMVGYHKRSDLAMQYAKRVVDEWKLSGEMGALRYIRVSMPPGDWIGGMDRNLDSGEPRPSATLEPFPAEFSEAAGKAYDVFVNYYIHQVNAIRFLLGESYRLTFGDRSGVLLAGESDSGVCVTLEMEAYRTTIEWHETALVAFEKGFVKVELPPPLARQRSGKVTVMRDDGTNPPTYTQPVLPNEAAMRSQARNFLAAIRGDRKAPCEAKEALEDLKLARDYIRFMQQQYNCY
ncbi:MAG: Gfo/Idh/MocA family oxidoreductase [Paenibacillaceae bacterium]|nr:Gfo/Idh/MocA family oxidoreductase [Paenibacillaceae bacterium]